MKRVILLPFFYLTFSFFMLISQDLPYPKNSQLYTEYICYKYTPYLKKPVISTGYIALNGGDKFIFRQLTPVEFYVKKINEKRVIKRANMDEITLTDSGANSEYDFSFLFDSSIDISKNFVVEKKLLNEKDKIEFLLAPLKKSIYTKITLIAYEDKIEKLELYLTNKTILKYEFKNTITGKEIDKKIFE